MHVVLPQSGIFEVQVFDLLVQLTDLVYYFFVAHYEVELLLESMVFLVQKVDLVAQLLDSFFVGLLVVLEIKFL